MSIIIVFHQFLQQLVNKITESVCAGDWGWSQILGLIIICTVSWLAWYCGKVTVFLTFFYSIYFLLINDFYIKLVLLTGENAAVAWILSIGSAQ